MFVLMTRQIFPDKYLVDSGVIDPDKIIFQFIQTEMARATISKGDVTLRMAMIRGVTLEPILMHWYGKLKTPPLQLAAEVAQACLRLLEAEK